jgi:hypothetical protein
MPERWEGTGQIEGNCAEVIVAKVKDLKGIKKIRIVIVSNLEPLQLGQFKHSHHQAKLATPIQWSGECTTQI